MSDDNNRNQNPYQNNPNYNNGNSSDQNRNNQNNNQNNDNRNNGDQNSGRQNDGRSYEDQVRSDQNQNNANRGNQNLNQNNGDQNYAGNDPNSQNNTDNGNRGNYEHQNSNGSYEHQDSKGSYEHENSQGNYDHEINNGNYEQGNFNENSGRNINDGGNFNNGNGGNGGNYDGNSNKNNNNRNIILAVLGTLILAAAIYFIFLKNKDKKEVEKTETVTQDTTSMAKVVLENDSIPKQIRDEDGEYYEDQEYVTESYVVANEAYLRSSPSASADSKVNTMKFGDKVYLKNGESVNGYSTVYLSKPAKEKNITEQPYYLLESTVVSQYEYKEFKEFFSLPPFSTLASKTKKLILDKKYDNGIDYKVTQNSDRAKNSLSYGDFDRDGIMDVAIVLDNNEKQASRLLIICTNKATKDPYLAFAENYSDKVKINSFKKGSLIYMNTDEFLNSPNDGIIVKGEDVKIAMIYDNSLQKFKSYSQE